MRHTIFRRRTTITLSLGLAAGFLAVSPAGAQAVEPADGTPVELGTAASFSVLGGAAVTNTGSSELTGDLGVSPGTSITGFPPGIVDGTIYAPPSTEAALAQADLTTAYGVAAGLTPVSGTYAELGGLSLTPGVYRGIDLAVTGELTLAGSAESVWVFQAAQSLTTASDSRIILTGGASVCNVFWQVGSSATLGTGSHFVGTVMANAAITATTGTVVDGRLLARIEAVTLDDTDIVTSDSCDDDTGGGPTAPVITSAAPPAGEVGTPYSHTITSTGNPAAHYTVSSGSLPAGLTLDTVTGQISGTPADAGTTGFTVTAANGTAPDEAVDYSIVIAAPAVVTPAGPPPTGSSTAPGGPAATGPAGSGSAGRTAAVTALASTGSSGAPAMLGGASAALAMGALMTLLMTRPRRAVGRG